MDGNTTISIALLIAVFGGIMTFLSFRRNEKKDNEADIENKVKMNMKLDQLCNTTNTIAIDIKDVTKSVQSLNERVAKVEQSTKSAHHRIDEHLGINKDESEDK
ncbi:hypothetical protein ACWG0P_14125 [Amedibacillus sp. YH-ame6]